MFLSHDQPAFGRHAASLSASSSGGSQPALGSLGGSGGGGVHRRPLSSGAMVLLPTSDASSSSAHIAMLEQQRALAQQRSAQRTAAGFGADGLTPASVGGDINCGAVVGPVSYPPRSTISRGAPVSSNTNNYANSAVGTVLLGSSSLSSGGSSSTGRPSSAAAAAGNDSISGLIAPAGFAVHCGPVVAVAGQLPTMMTMANSSGLDVTYSGGRPGTAQTQQQQQQQPQGVVVGLGGRPHSMRLLQAASQPPALIGASGIPFHRPSTSSVGSVLHPGIGGAQPMAILQPTQPQQFQFQQSMQSPEQYGGRPMTAGQQQQAPIAFTATVIPTAAGDAFDVTSGRPGAAGRGSQQPQRVIYRLQPSQSQASQQQNQQAQMQQPQFGNMAYASYACGGGNGVHQGPYSFLAGPQYTSSISSSVSGAAAAAAAVAVSDGLEVEYLAPVNPVPQPQQQHEEGDYSDAAVADTAVEELQPVVSKSASNNKRPGSGSTTSSTGSSGEREKERGATLTTTTTSSPPAASGRSGNRRPSPSSALISRDREGEGAVFDGAMLRKPADSRHLPVAPALHSAPSDADLMQHDRRGSTVKAEASSAVPFGLQSLSPPPPFEPTSLADVRRFVLTPAPQGYGPMQCTIVRDRTSSLSHRLHPVYTLYVKRCTTTTGATGSSKAQPPTAGDGTFILAGRKRPHNKTSNYIMSLDAKDLNRDSPSFVGKLRSNFVGTEFSIFDDGFAKGKVPVNADQAHSTGVGKGDVLSTDKNNVRQELGVITYASNVLGSRGPRKMKVALPRINSLGQRAVFGPLPPVMNQAVHKPKEASPAGGSADEETMLTAFRNGYTQEMLLLINKPPKWNESVGAFVLNFGGRVTQASVKNFQLVSADDHDTILLQFGRCGKDIFTMDFAWPLCPLQAFAITLSSFDFKLACE